ncbi:MerR family transcriptional regulator [Noviherbaspirillum sp.]|jgi:DNA-binding transcriptional MerR regulator|uniref:MerR family transcriptional regulator n=1 Tax=Noviherbaspirillum sp. TaxID=1926288 RepID=UPI0025D9ED4A|nr:MerR family transcriptional regulator [Noviherbaspirillum sp.]
MSTAFEEPLRIGALAARAGMTVRMLHHYDRIGLLKPSGRSGSAYRLYSTADVARLQAIQGLRQLGLSLREIQNLLRDESDRLPEIVDRQIHTIERQIAQSRQLYEQLLLLKSAMMRGEKPTLDDHLRLLTTMSTYERYFSPGELAKFFESRPSIEERWPPLITAIRDAMNRAVPIDSLELQPLARQWMDLSLLMARGDYDLMKRWEKMYLQEPAVRGKAGDDLELVTYINRAIELRLTAFYRHVTPEQFKRLDFSLETEWEQLRWEFAGSAESNLRLRGAVLRQARVRYRSLVDRMAAQEPTLAEKYITALCAEPLLRAGSILGPDLERRIHENPERRRR